MQEDETGLRHLFGVAVAGCPAMSPRRTGARMRPVQGRTGWREQTAEGGGGHEVWRPRGPGGGRRAAAEMGVWRTVLGERDGKRVADFGWSGV